MRARSQAVPAACPECGAAVDGGRAACRSLFDAVLAREYSDAAYAGEHRLTVDTYALQHPEAYMRSAKSYAAHLTGMFAAMETTAASDCNRAVQRWLNGPKALSRPGQPPPSRRGSLTIADVHDAVDPDDHHRRVRAWARSAWEAWSEFHDVARCWTRAAMR